MAVHEIHLVFSVLRSLRHSEIDELRRKANEGALTAEEAAEYKDFVEALDVISIIQAKARRYLAEHSA